MFVRCLRRNPREPGTGQRVEQEGIGGLMATRGSGSSSSASIERSSASSTARSSTPGDIRGGRYRGNADRCIGGSTRRNRKTTNNPRTAIKMSTARLLTHCGSGLDRCCSMSSGAGRWTTVSGGDAAASPDVRGSGTGGCRAAVDTATSETATIPRTASEPTSGLLIPFHHARRRTTDITATVTTTPMSRPNSALETADERSTTFVPIGRKIPPAAIPRATTASPTATTTKRPGDGGSWG